MHDLAALLDHRHLVFASRYGGCLECGDVCSLADRVGEEADRDACLEITHFDFGFYGWVSLKAGNGNQVHVIEA